MLDGDLIAAESDQRKALDVGGSMHIAFRRDRVADPARRAEMVDRIGAGAMPVIPTIPGCAGGIVVAVGEDAVMCAGLFADAAGSQLAADHFAEWAPRHLADLLIGPGEVEVGEVWGDPMVLIGQSAPVAGSMD